MSIGLETATRVSLKSDAAYLPRIRRIATCLAENVGMGEEQAQDAALVLTEACVNAIRHGSPNGKEDSLALTFRATGRTVVADVSDSGGASKLASGNSDAGLGLRLMGALTDRMRFIRRRAGLTVRITMRAKRRQSTRDRS